MTKQEHETTHAMMLACANVKGLLQKNEYYTHDDLITAIGMACDFIYQKKDFKLLKIGNHKLHNNTMIFDLPSIMTCACRCNHCYALKSERIYKNTRLMRLQHLLIIDACRHSETIKNQVINQLYNEIITYSNKSMGMVYVRLHSSGDFYCNEYLQMILDLIKRCETIKNVRFYTYTKQLDNKKIDDINKKYYNFNIVKSFITGNDNKKYINYGNIEYLKQLKKVCNDLFICSYGTDKQATCMGNCTKCACHAHVAFIQH